MNEIILAYGLGIVSVGLFVLARVVLKADKKVSEHQQWIESFQREYELNLERLHRHIDDQRSVTNRDFEDVHRKIDSRIDKLEFKVKDQLNFIKNKTSQAY
jgi:cupin superfamily acireductone dioxygenase involved in methionine salvage